MATAFTLFGMNVVHDRAPPSNNQGGPTSYQEYIDFLKQQVHQPSAVTPSLPPCTSSPSLHTKDKDIRIQCQVRARIPTNEGGEMYLHLYKNNQDTKEHLAIVYGDLRSRSLDDAWANETILNRVVRGAYYGKLEEIVAVNEMDIISKLTPDQMVFLEQQQAKAKQQWEEHQNQLKDKITPPLVRVHSECFTGETVHSGRCDCGEQLDEAMRQMQLAGRGVIVYLRQEGRGIGLLEKLKAYNLQDLGHDTVAANVLLNHPADGRTYGIANAILKDLQVSKVHLLTNNPDKIQQLESYGDIKVLERHEMIPRSWTCTPSSDDQQLHQPTAKSHLSVNNPAAAFLLDRTPSSSPALGSPSVFDLPKKELDRYLAVKVKKMGHILDLPDSLNTSPTPK